MYLGRAKEMANKDWGKAIAVALLFNFSLFLIMPALINVQPQKQKLDDIGPMITLMKVRTPQKQEKKKEKPPEPPKQREPQKMRPVKTTSMPRTHLSLPLELNPRLPAVPGGLKLPPIDSSLPTIDISGLFSVGELDGPLMPLAQIPPTYPLRARRMQTEGWVTVRFIINEQGRVSEVKVLQSQPKGIFDSAVTNAVQRWTFRPCTISGTPVKTWVEQTIKFNLD